TDARQALAQIASAKAELEQARLRLGYATVTAPIDGRARRALVTEGALVGEFRNPHRELLPGGYVQVRLQRAVNPQAITVPRDALIRTAQSAVVKVVNPQG
ncbi:efflux transporter periplasmic adaptor subunit, partial [Escherichia coli]